MVAFGIDKLGRGASVSTEKYTSIIFSIIGQMQSIKNII